MSKLPILILFILILLFSSSCSDSEQNEIQKVGMLVEDSIRDQAWGEKGHKGLLNIGKEYNVDVYFEDGVQTEQQIINKVDEFARHGVNLIFGHSNIYGKYFTELSPSYPNVHFVYFNGPYYEENVTSLNFNSHAMGFFGGMVASKMTKTNKIGVIAAYEWQPEVEGFYEGAKYQNPNVGVTINYINNWNDKNTALEMYEKMKEKEVDVFYPAGDSYSVEVIKRLSEEGLYAIGYVSDQSTIDKTAVLTSTVQHVDKLYQIVAEKFINEKLNGGILTFDMEDNVISLGEFSREIPLQYQEYINNQVEVYVKTGLLPNEQ